MFLDGLLTFYQQMKTGGFRVSLSMDCSGKIGRIRAVLAAQGTRNLRGVFELTKALQEIDDIENKAQLCFTKFRHTITTNKWTFDSTKDNVVLVHFFYLRYFVSY